MNLRELVATVIHSHAQDWHVTDGHRADGHLYLAAYIPDATIALAWGRECMPDFDEAWAVRFPNRHAVSCYAELLFHGTVVFRDIFVAVDGGRCNLPMPDLGTKAVPVDRANFVALLAELEDCATQDFGYYFKRAGLSVVERPWPDFLAAKE